MRKNTRHSLCAQLQCLRSGVWEPGNEASMCMCASFSLESGAARGVRVQTTYQRLKLRVGIGQFRAFSYSNQP